MENNLSNRAPQKRLGRPPAAVSEARPPAEPVQEAPVMSTGLVCPCCGRAMVPKTLAGNDSSRYNRCTLCGGKFRVFLRNGIRLAQVIR